MQKMEKNLFGWWGKKGEKLRTLTFIPDQLYLLPSLIWNGTKYCSTHEPHQQGEDHQGEDCNQSCSISRALQHGVKYYLIFFNFILVNRSHVQTQTNMY